MIEKYREVAFQADSIGCWPLEAAGDLEPGVMRVLYIGGVPEMCKYLCPCGCGMPCPTYFENEHRKRTQERHLWNFSRGANGPTLSPSVRHTGGCKSHYNITDGKVQMHAS